MNATSRSSKLQELGATPAKLALIAILGVILIGSFLVNFGFLSSDPAPTATKAPPKPTSNETTKSHAANSTSTAKVPEESRSETATTSKQKICWPSVTVADAAKFDPFARPSFIAAPEPDKTAETSSRKANRPSRLQRMFVQLKALQKAAQEKHALAQAREQEARTHEEENKEAAMSLQDSGISFIVSSGDNITARIGDKTVAIGDRIGRFRIVDIQQTGVIVAPVDESEVASGTK
ncbi:MAG: hypothetical protein KDB27_17620 [Planctomycetales bacterium]|nr:hypothetical protein [Planctomycetales bacterium]